ncbi:putative damage-inducible protein DinB [Paenibacillus shirakamiensis]|uniref:Damage-inducible protein DinB n=1 Tax=Paenibacillus shirakamiensis TaxID=1265935 RepID=A0ABS4JKM1_9BACL|nr:DinB family protein [Paenibacillus shirakamiensis]MBP2002267.1 putative damage-inducible protein DinB [Paenibacillus shirakamiensis]
MSYVEIHPVWRTIRERYQKMIQGLPQEDLGLRLAPDASSIGHMIRHNAEVEYMFASWFFGSPVPEHIEYLANGKGGLDNEAEYTAEEIVAFSAASDAHLTDAMRNLPEQAWDVAVDSPIGPSTPREALGRTMYHSGLHAGQISLIRKHALRVE